MHARRRFIVQSFALIWLDSSIGEFDDNYHNLITQLREISSTIHTFTDVNQCVDFLTEIKDQKVFMIMSNTLDQQILSLIHEIPQLYSIYLFCENQTKTQCTTEWIKVKDSFSGIDSLCRTLKRDIEQCDRDSISICVTNEDVNRLDSSFMYTQLLKETLLEMRHDDKEKEELAIFCRKQFSDSSSRLQIIDEFEQDYRVDAAIWWYTRDCFIYQMVNQALRLQEINMIIKMGFYIRDLSLQIEQLYTPPTEKFTVYRGQGLANADFEKVRTRQNGLLSFNSFISTSKNRQVSLLYAESSRENPLLIGILFQICIDPALKTIPFASLDNVSYFSDSEEEILFSMHTVFRIGQIKAIDDRLWEVELILTNEDDPELKRLTEYIREETQGSTGWYRLSRLLAKMGDFDQAEYVCHTLFQETDNKRRSTDIYYLTLGFIENKKGNYQKALEFFQKAFQIQLEFLPLHYPDLATACNNVASVYLNMANYSEALKFYQKALEFREKSPTPKYSHLADTYNNIAFAHTGIGEYLKALEFYRKALEIYQKYIPLNHPNFANTYNNIGHVHCAMEEYSKALELYQKSFEIQRKSLPPDHPELAQTYNNIGIIHVTMGEYTKALEFYQKVLEIQKRMLSWNHPHLAIYHNNIGGVYEKMTDYSKALEFFQKALEIYQTSLPQNHPDIAVTYSNIAGVHSAKREYSKALMLYQKALEIEQESLPGNNLTLAVSYASIAGVYFYMENYPKVLEFYYKALEIKQKVLPPMHFSLATNYHIIGSVYKHIGEYSKALEFYQRTLEIYRSSLPSNHSDFATIYDKIAEVYYHMEEYSKSLEFYQKTLEIEQTSLPSNHFNLVTTYRNVGSVYDDLGEYSKAIEFFQKTIEIQKKSLPQNHPDLASTYNSIAVAHDNMGEYSMALSFYERAFEILQCSVHPDHPHLKSCQESIAEVRKKL